MSRKYAFSFCAVAFFALLGAGSLLAQPAPPTGANTNCTTASVLADLERTNYIFFTCSGTITITNPITIGSDVTFEGPTNNGIILSGGNASRIFSVAPGGRLTLINITLSGGKGAKGGAINNQGVVMATNCVFKDNKAPGPNGTNGVAGQDGYPNGTDGANGVSGTSGLGGAIWNTGELYLTRCTFSANSATGGNGGAGGKGGNAINRGFNSGDGGNGGVGAVGRGGAIFTAGLAEVTECVFENNTTTGGNGGAAGAGGTGGVNGKPGTPGQGAIASGAAIHNAASLKVNSCTFSDNRADAGDSAAAAGENQGNGNDGLVGGQAWGGGICNLSLAEVINSTFSTNRVFGGDGSKGADGSLKGGRGGDGGSAFGGNFYNNGEGSLVNCTFAGGSAKGGTNGLGGAGATAGSSGIAGANKGGNIARVGGTLAIKNNIFARPGTGGNGSGAVSDFGYNLSSDGTINLNGTESMINTAPGMGHLSANGGFGKTFALGSHSAAIDAGDPGDSPEVDQRGIPIFGERRDIGAYEFAASSITVTVTDSGGAAVAGVQIVAGGITNVTPASGIISLPALPAGEYTVVPSHPLYTFEPPSETVELGPAVSLTFTAVRTFSVSGYVRDGSRPIEDVTITAGGQETTTDTNGFYKITGLDAGSYNVQPSSGGYGFVPSLQQINLQSDTTNVNFTAVGLLSISGRIRTEAGQGLAGVVVRAGNRSAVTAPTGDYTITQVPSREQVVTPSLGGYSFLPPSLTLTPTTDENGVDFTAYTSFQISGVVLNSSNGLGANAVTITLSTNGVSGPPSPGGSAILLTDTNGFFSFTNLRAGSYVVTPSKTGHAFLPATNLLVLGPSQTNLVYQMFPAFTMSGRVTLNGVPMGGVDVFLYSNNTQLAWVKQGTSYSFPNYPRGTYVIMPRHPDFQFNPTNITVNLAGNSNNLDFVASGVYSIRGRVTKDSNGLANVTVRAGNAVSITDANGNYALTNVPPGNYSVTADDARYAMQPSSISVSVGPDQSNVDFRAVEVYTINGEVTEGAFPLGGVVVSAGGVTNFTAGTGRYTLPRVPAGSNVVVRVALAGYEFTPAQQSVVLDSLKNGINFTARGLSSVSGRVVDAITSNGLTRVKITIAGRYETLTTNGNYLLTNVGPGLLTVVPSQTNRGFAPISRQVLVPTNSVATNVNFVGFRASKLFGRIVDDILTNGIANVSVRAEGIYGTNIVVTDADGNYVFPTLRNGFYKLTPSQSGKGFEPQFYDVDLTADTRRDFVGFPGFSISGRVVDANALVGIPNIQVNVSTPEISSILTDTNGNFTFSGLREGDYSVTPIAFGYDVTPTGRQLTLGPTNATSVTFLARGNLTVVGRVLEGSSGVSNIQIRIIGTNTPPLSRNTSSGASGVFVFTNLPPGLVTVQPTLTGIFTPSNYVLDPLGYDEPVFRVATRLTATRSTNGLKLTLRGLPSQSYTLQTNLPGRINSWLDYRPLAPTDANGIVDFFPATNILSNPSLFFRSRR